MFLPLMKKAAIGEFGKGCLKIQNQLSVIKQLTFTIIAPSMFCISDSH